MVSLDEIRARLARDGQPIPGPHVLGTAIARLLQSRADRAHLLTLLDERDAQIAAVRELHRADPINPRRCAHEWADWPCPTIKALDAKGGAS